MKSLLQAAEAKGISHKVTSDDSDDQISAIYVKVKEGYDIGQVNSKIQGHTRKASAIRTRSMLTDVSDSLTGISSTISGLIGMVWILALLILLLCFAMIVRERKREFAVLRLLGTSRAQLCKIVLSESFLCSLSGALLGIAVSALIVFPFTTLIEQKLALPYLQPAPSEILLLALLVVLATTLVGALASSWAALRLSRADPGTDLREGN